MTCDHHDATANLDTIMAVFDGVCYSLSPSLSPTRRNELSAILDLNGAAPHAPYTHLIAPTASHGLNNATTDPALKLVTDRWVDRSVVMGKRQPYVSLFFFPSRSTDTSILASSITPQTRP